MTTDNETRVQVGVGVAVVQEGAILLVERGREPAKGQWAVPGGKVEFGETLREAAAREVREETGLEVEIGEPVWVGERIEETIHIALIDFLGTQTGGELVAGDDAADARWVDLDEAERYPLTSSMYELISKLKDMT